MNNNSSMNGKKPAKPIMCFILAAICLFLCGCAYFGYSLTQIEAANPVVLLLYFFGFGGGIIYSIIGIIVLIISLKVTIKNIRYYKHPLSYFSLLINIISVYLVLKVVIYIIF